MQRVVRVIGNTTVFRPMNLMIAVTSVFSILPIWMTLRLLKATSFRIQKFWILYSYKRYLIWRSYGLDFVLYSVLSILDESFFNFLIITRNIFFKYTYTFDVLTFYWLSPLNRLRRLILNNLCSVNFTVRTTVDTKDNYNDMSSSIQVEFLRHRLLFPIVCYYWCIKSDFI